MLSALLRTRRPAVELLALAAVSLSLGACSGGCGPGSGTSSTASPDSDKSKASTTTSAKSATAAAASSASSAPVAGGAAPAAKPADPLFEDPAAIVETKADETAAFVVQPDGTTKLALAGSDGTPLVNRSAKLEFIAPDEKATAVPLEADGATKTLIGKGPALGEDVTPVRYEITGGKEPWTGVLHLPAGGTKALLANAKSAGDARAEPATGPHGGAVERVGEDDVEVLVDEDSGEARVWVLDANQKVIKPEGRVVHLYIDGLRLEPKVTDGDVMVAKFDKGAPRRVTILLVRDSKRYVVLAGLRPRMYLRYDEVPGKVVFVVLGKDKKIKVDKNPDSPGLGHAKGKTKGDDGNGKGNGGGNGKGNKGKGKGH